MMVVGGWNRGREDKRTRVTRIPWTGAGNRVESVGGGVGVESVSLPLLFFPFPSRPDAGGMIHSLPCRHIHRREFFDMFSTSPI